MSDTWVLLCALAFVLAGFIALGIAVIRSARQADRERQ